MSYSREELALLNYKELRKLCKQAGVKANKKHCELVVDLAEYFSKAEDELKEMEKEMEQYEAIDLNTTFTFEEEDDKEDVKETNKEKDIEIENKDVVIEGNNGDNKENENDVDDKKCENIESTKCEQVVENVEDEKLLKATLMKEVERRAEEKLSKIPRFIVDKVVVPNIAVPQPATPELSKKTNSGIKMDSIDMYLEKKKKRANDHLKLKDNFKENSIPSKRVSQARASLSRKPTRKSVKIDTTFEFNPKLKSTPGLKETRVLPRIAALKDTNRPKPILSVSKANTTLTSTDKSTEKNKKKRVTLSGFSARRKTDVRKSISGKSEVRKSFSQSPFGNKPETPKAKTPIKFDLQQSLKKSLTYKPHTGKLKDQYFTQETSVAGVPRKIKLEERKKVSVKEMTKNISTRDKRRNEAAAKRGKNRLVVLDKRRGIVG